MPNERGRVLRRVSLLIAFFVASSATAARADSIWYDFTRDTERVLESIAFSSDGVTVTAVGFNTQEERQVYQGPWGLGVTAAGDSSAQVDGNPHRETLRLVFSEEIHVAAVYFDWIEGSGDDFSLELDGQLVASNVSPGNGWWQMPATYADVATTTVDLIADHQSDDFLVRGIHVKTWKNPCLPPNPCLPGGGASGTPEPTAALLFGLGGLLVGRSIRSSGRAGRAVRQRSSKP